MEFDPNDLFGGDGPTVTFGGFIGPDGRITPPGEMPDDIPDHMRPLIEGLVNRLTGGDGDDIGDAIKEMRRQALIERGPFFALHQGGTFTIGDGTHEPIEGQTFELEPATLNALIDARTAAELAECDLQDHVNMRRRHGVNRANEAMHQRVAGYKPSVAGVTGEVADVLNSATAEFLPAQRTNETYLALCRSTAAMLRSREEANVAQGQVWENQRTMRRRFNITAPEVLQWMVVNRSNLLLPEVTDEEFRAGVEEYARLAADDDQDLDDVDDDHVGAAASDIDASD